MSLLSRRSALLLGAFPLCGATLATGATTATTAATPRYDAGADDQVIRIGNTAPYSGPASAWATSAKAMAAEFARVNAEGGILGRRIRLLSRDDGYNPARTVEQVRRLVEDDGVLLMLAPLGTAQNAAIQAYLNARGVPQLFINSGASRWGDPQRFPWTMGFTPSYRTEGRAYGLHIRASQPQARVAVLYQNDDLGRDYLQGITDGLGPAFAGRLVAHSHEVTDATVDSQVLAMKASGADTFIHVSGPKFAAQAIRRAGEAGWKPAQYLATISNSLAAVLRPAGVEHALGMVSAVYLRDPSDPAVQATQVWRDHAATLRAHDAALNPEDPFNANGTSIAQAMVQVLRQAGNQLTRANIMRNAANLDLSLPMLAPGIRVQTSASDFRPISQLQLTRFDGQRFVPFGPLIDR